MKFCFNCGSKLQPSSKFCPECGEKLYQKVDFSSVELFDSKKYIEEYLITNSPNTKGEITCPRCLGDGYVSNEDIQRLHATSIWSEGDCLCCNSTGVVDVKKVNRDTFPLMQHEDLYQETKLDNNGILKHGFINRNGEWIIQPIYDYVSGFSSGLKAVVSFNQKYGVINEKGDWIIQPMFDNISINGLEEKIYVSINDKWGIINQKGNWIIQPMFDEIKEEENIGSQVKVNDKWGIINQKGNWIIQPMFDKIYCGFEEGDYHDIYVSINDKMGIINQKGDWIIQPIYDKVLGRNSDGNIWARINDKWGIINQKGDWIVQPMFEDVGAVYIKDQTLSVSINGKYGIVNETGDWIIHPMFDKIDPEGFDEKGFLGVLLDGKIGWVNKSGELIIKNQFKLAAWDILQRELFGGVFTDFDHNDRAIVLNFDDKFGIIDRKGNWVVKPVYDKIKQEGFDHKGYVCVEVEGKIGWIDKDGNTIIKNKFDSQSWGYMPGFNNDRCILQIKDGNYGIIDRTGEWVVHPKHFLLEEKIIGLELVYKASQNNKYGYIDKNGNWIISPRFDYIPTDFEGDDMIWNDSISDWETAPFENDDDHSAENHINQSIESYFNHLQSKESLYLKDNLPTKKIKNFIKQFNADFFTEEGKILVYYDDTLWGKGDNGFLIYDKDSVLYLFVNFYMGATICLCFEDDGINDILQSSQMKKGDLILEYYDQDGTKFIEDNHCTNDSWFALNDFINENLPLDIDPDEF